MREKTYRYYFTHILKPLEVTFIPLTKTTYKAFIHIGKDPIATANLEMNGWWWIEEHFGDFKQSPDFKSFLRAVSWLAQDFINYYCKILGVYKRKTKLRKIEVAGGDRK